MNGVARTTPRSVLMTADTVGGVWTFALQLAGSLGRAGVSVTIAAMGGPPSTAQRAAAARIPTVTLHESAYKLPWMQDPWDDLEAASDWLLDLAARVRPDLVHVNDPTHAALPWPAPTVAVAHSCVLSWWQAVHGESAPGSWERYRLAMRRGLEAADLVVAPSRAMLAALATHYGVRGGRVVPNGLDPAEFMPAPKEPFVLAAGRLWDDAKNLRALESIAPRLRYPIYVAGDLTHPDGGIAPVRHVHALGQLAPAELARWLGHAAVYALPARYEPFGLSVLEAALSGCALVLGDIPSLRENWSGRAVFVPPDDPNALLAALAGLLDDDHLRQTLSMRARRQALVLSADRMRAGYLEAYAAALVTPRRRTTAEVPA